MTPEEKLKLSEFVKERYKDVEESPLKFYKAEKFELEVMTALVELRREYACALVEEGKRFFQAMITKGIWEGINLLRAQRVLNNLDFYIYMAEEVFPLPWEEKLCPLISLLPKMRNEDCWTIHEIGVCLLGNLLYFEKQKQKEKEELSSFWHLNIILGLAYDSQKHHIGGRHKNSRGEYIPIPESLQKRAKKFLEDLQKGKDKDGYIREEKRLPLAEEKHRIELEYYFVVIAHFRHLYQQ